MKKSSFLIGLIAGNLLWLPFATCQAAEKYTLSLRELVSYAVREYPTILSAQANAESANKEIDRAKAALWPTIGFNTNYQTRNQMGAGRGILAAPEVRYTVFAGGGISAEIERNEKMANAARGKITVAQNEVALIAAEAFINFGRAQEAVKLAEDNLHAHEAILNRVQAIADVDHGRQADVKQAAVRVEGARIALTQKNSELEVGRRKLNRFWPEPLNGTVILSDLDAGAREVPPSLEKALEAINDHHPLMAVPTAQKEAATSATDVARSKRWPRVEVSGTRWRNPNTLDDEPVGSVNLNLPVFAGGGIQAGIESADAQHRAAQFAVDDARLILRERISSAWVELNSSIERYNVGQIQIENQKSVLTSYAEQFTLGRRTLFDLLNVQNESFNNQLAALNALFDSRISRQRLTAGMGELGRSYGGQ